jgi:phosphoglycolate phosphatase-like HAD superfamily hydrolase
MKYDLLVWDFDGTLADTLALSLRIYNEVAGKHGYRPVTDPEGARHLSTLAFLKAHGIPLLKLPLLVREFLAAQRREIASVRLFPEIAQTVSELRDMNCRLGVLSSNSRDNILACLESNGAAGAFDFIVGYTRLLGKGRALRRLLKDQKAVPGKVLYIGDEVRDIEAAREAMADVAAVTWGLHAGEFLAQHAPTYLVSRPAELVEVLTR